jgi:hypothetical protein
VERLETRDLPAGFAPTAWEQLFLERLNDARANPAAYGRSIGLNLAGVAPSSPLVFDTRLIRAARLHSFDMNARRFFDHVNPSGQDPGARIAGAGFPAAGYGESIARGFPTVEHALSGLIIDHGIPDLGHRRHLLAMSNAHRLVGVGIYQSPALFGNQYTIDTADTATPRTYLAGVAYNDRNANRRYDVGEGLGGVTVHVVGVGVVRTWASGGYVVAVPPGRHRVVATGAGLGTPSVQDVAVGGANVRLNFTTTSVQLTAGLLRKAENAGAALITVTRTGGAGGATTVRYAATAGSATAGGDFTPVTGTLTFAPGQRRKTFAVPLADDALREGGETVRVELSGVGGGARLGLSRATLIVADNEPNDNGLFVAGLFRDLLGRGPSALTLALRQEKLDAARAGALAPIARDIVNSAEYRMRVITGLFQSYLGRAPESWELNAWLLNWAQPRFQLGILVADLIGGNEYRGRQLDPATGKPSDAAWLAAAFRDVLGRAPTAAERASWLKLLGRAGGAFNVAFQLWWGQEGVTRRATEAYQLFHLRPPTAAQVNAWRTVVARGGAEEQLLANVVGSDACLEVHGDTGAAWLDAAFRKLLGRPPSSAESDAVLGRLTAGYFAARQAEARGVLANAEYAARLLGGHYQRLLGQPPAGAVLAPLVKQYQRGTTEEQLLASLAGSPAYFAHPNKGKGDAATWVSAVYLDLLGQAPTAAESAAALLRLQAGATRTAVALDLLRGALGRTRLIGSYYALYLRRAATADEVAAHLAQFAKGWKAPAVLADLLARREYFSRAHG